MVMQLWALVVDCFRDAIDRKLFWVMLAISLAIAAGMACVGFDDQGVSILFGAWRFDAPEYVDGNELGRAIIGSILTKYIADTYIGWIGIILALIATCGIYPGLMERGAVDVVAAKPISRPMIFLGKYLGSMMFVAVQAAVFVVLTFLVVGLRWHYWFPGYLWSALLIVVLFSYIYAFTALFAVLTRSAMTALLLSLVAWFVMFIPQTAHVLLVTYNSTGDLSVGNSWVRTVGAVKWVLPKTQDIPFIAGKLIGAATESEVIVDPQDTDMPEDLRRRMATQIEAERQVADVNAFHSIGTSLLFEIVIVALAVWRFCRMDF